MNIWVILGEISLVILALFFLFFSIFSLLERERRAFWRSIFIFILIFFINLALLFLKVPIKSWLFGGIFVLIISALLLLIFPLLKKSSTEIVDKQQKIDERDTIFARFDYKEGTDVFEDYYQRKPEYKDRDDEIRKILDILSPPQIKKNPQLFSLAAAEFDFLEHQITQVHGKTNKEKIEVSPAENTRKIKSVIHYLGSEVCGICPLNQAYVYSHVGRGPEPYGQKIELDHKYAIVFALEMDIALIASAPKAPVIIETGKKYVETARISIVIADFIRRLGYSARAHIAGSNYQAMLPPLAWEAGLGELGRLGILITHKFGPRARLGLVTTELPLIPDEPKTLGIQNFCQRCQKCATNCPAQAIPYGEKTEENSVLKWVLNREDCYRFWRKAGTDCAVCIYVCPYSKPDNIFHNLIRKMTESSSVAQTLSIRGDDFFYGRRPLQRKSPLDM